MQSTSTSWRWTIWIACFAVLMNALAPSISHAMAAVYGVPATSDICRADAGAGALAKQRIAKITEESTGKSTGKNTALMADCGYCLPHGGSVALTPSVITGLGLVKGHALRPFLFYRAPQPLLALAAVPARGPPVVAALS